MERPSSISNSDAAGGGATGAAPLPGGFPWAFVGALVLLAGVEVALRARPAASLVTYRNGIDEHYAIAQYLDALGPADVGFLGSSMTRNGISAPEVKAALGGAAGREVYAANYAGAGMTADEAAAAVRYMLRRGRAPGLLMVEVSPRTFRTSSNKRLNESAVFWDFKDWLAAHKAARTRARLPDAVGPTPSEVGDVLPNVLRNQAGDYCRTLRYRKYVARVASFRTRQRSAPMAGGLWIDPEVEGVVDITGEGKRRKLQEAWRQNNMEGGKFAYDPALLAAFDDLLRTCKQAGQPVVVYEMPVSDAVKDLLPGHVYEEFDGVMAAAAARHGVRYVAFKELGLALTNADYSEISHLNPIGAAKLTRAMTEKVVIPEYLRTRGVREP